MTDNDQPPSIFKAVTWLTAGVVAAIFLSGVTAGYLSAMAEEKALPISPAFGAAIVGLAIAAPAIILFARSLPHWKSMSPRRQSYWASIGVSALVGGLIGALLVLDENVSAGAMAIFSNGPLSPNFAIAAAALWCVGLGISIVIYHRAVDDHEERAWLWAGLAGWYAFVLPAPVWWVLHRAAVAAPIDAMILFIFSMLVNAIVWLWLKFR